MQLHQTKVYEVTFGINLCDNSFQVYDVFASSEKKAIQKAVKLIQQNPDVKSYGLLGIQVISI